MTATLEEKRALVARMLEQRVGAGETAPPPAVLTDLLAAQVARTPDAVAVVGAEGGAEVRLTFAELDRRANRLAHRLIAAGVRPDVPVGVHAERGVAAVAAVLAVLKAGGAYLPLDPDYPADRLAFMLEQAGAPVLLAARALAGAFPAFSGTVLRLEDGLGIGTDVPDTPPPQRNRPDDLVYVMFTSGSTGQPKGVMKTHAAVCNRLLWMQRTHRLDAGDAVLHKTPLSFDVSVWEMFWPLLAGARMVLAAPGGHRDPAHLIERICAESVSTLHFVPAMAAVFAEEPGLEACTSLRRVLLSGEPLSMELVRRLSRRLTAEIYNYCGPTEADVTVWRCDPACPSAMAPIGRPIHGLEVRLLDERGREVPLGETGEIHIGGIGVARGYVNRPELTAERFVRLPGQPGVWYRTGDLGCWLPDGNLAFLGRSDDQVKIRGSRVEPGEIEAVLMTHPSVRLAAVVAEISAAGDARLVAHAVPEAGREASAAELRAYLGARLPHFMLPAEFRFAEAFPHTPSGKIDRRALAVAPLKPAAAVPAAMGPAAEVAGLFAELLGRPVGPDDDFFTAGGNSLLAVRLVARIQKRFGVRLPVAALVEGPTPAALARRLDAAASTPDRNLSPAAVGWSPLLTLEPEGARPPLFLIHPAGGGALCYLRLVRALGRGRPVHAFQAPGLEPGQVPFASVGAMAEHYLEILRRIQPTGPWRLAGWSMGGIVAFEMAARIERDGGRVAFLGLLDGGELPGADVSADRSNPWVAVADALCAAPGVEALARFGSSRLGLPMGGEMLAAMPADERRRVLIGALQSAGLIPPDVQADGLGVYLSLIRHHLAAEAAYRPTPITGAIMLFKAEGEWGDGRRSDPLLGWGGFAGGGITVVPVPGDHLTMLTPPNVEVLAERLAARLADADR